MTIDVYHSNRFERLWDRFQQQIDRPLGLPLATELIVVPASGWESYFSRRLVQRRGCWAQFECCTLGSWLNRVLGAALGRDRVAARDPDAMTWAIAARLPGLLDDPAFAPVTRYLQADGGGADLRRRIDLARSIASLFDQYLVYRPELIAAWRDGRDAPEGESLHAAHAAWQRRLFQAIEQDRSIPSLSELVEELQGKTESLLLPERVSVWMAGGFPAVQLAFLDLIGRHTQIAMYVIGSTPTYWGDYERRREILSRMPFHPSSLRSFCAAEQLDPPHPLVESLGRQALNRQWLLLPFHRPPWQHHDLDADAGLPVGGTLLQQLQHDLCRGQLTATQATPDASLSIHSCHSAIREVEVLRDQLRAAFESDPKLQPEDVVVCCPDLETYGPLVDAVFGISGPDDPGYIPYAVVGRSPRRTRPVVEAYFQLLEVLPSRFEASRLLDLLSIRSIQSAAGLDDDQVQTVAGWVADSGIRWGADAGHRESERLPRNDLNTWQFGLDRLLMGYAMPPGGGQLAGDVVALDRAEGLAGEMLGRLADWIGRLHHWRNEIERARPLAEWQAVFLGLADEFLDIREDEIALQRIRSGIDSLARTAERNGFDDALPFSMAAAEVSREVDQVAGGRPFQLGGVAFCEMTAMRSLPFQVIALLGLNDGVFPRTDRPVGFDLMARNTRPGDRSVRLEDKHLILEMLLSARGRLIITFQGQNVRDQRLRPPSVVVEELLETAETICGGDVKLRDVLVTRHPLQPFSPRYYDATYPELFSYDQRQLQAAEALTGRPQDPPVFFERPLPELEELHEIRIRDLRRLLDRPWELFLGRLGVRLPESPEADSDREPLVLNALEQWAVGDHWLQRRLAESPEAETARSLLRSGGLPAGPLGRNALHAVARQADRVVRTAETNGVEADMPRTPVRIAIGPHLIVGRLDGLTAQGVRRATYSRIDNSRVLRMWLDHLLATAMLGRSAGETRLVGRPKDGESIVLLPIEFEAAMTELENLVRLYRIALRLPLPFFSAAVPKALDLLRKQEVTIEDGMFTGDLINVARRACEYSPYGAAELDLPSARTAFAGRDPFEMRCADVPGLEVYQDGNLFAYLIETICLPMLEYIAG